MVVSEESRSSEGQSSKRVLSLNEKDEDLRDFPHPPRVVGSSERYILSTTILTTTTATPISSAPEDLDFVLPSPPEEESEEFVATEEAVTFSGDFEGGDVEVAVEEGRRRRSRFGRGGRSTCGRRPCRNAVVEESQIPEEFVLPPESEDEDLQASLPPRLIFTIET